MHSSHAHLHCTGKQAVTTTVRDLQGHCAWNDSTVKIELPAAVDFLACVLHPLAHIGLQPYHKVEHRALHQRRIYVLIWHAADLQRMVRPVWRSQKDEAL